MAIDGPDATWLARAVAAEIRALKARRGLNQVTIAAKLGRSQGYVSERLNGHAPFDLDDIDGIAQLVEADPFDFLLSIVENAQALEDSDGEIQEPWAARRAKPERKLEGDE